LTCMMEQKCDIIAACWLEDQEFQGVYWLGTQMVLI